MRSPIPFVVAVVLAVAPHSATAGHSCTGSGATWTWRAMRGHEYEVFPSGTTCSFARTWIARLTREPLVPSGGERLIRGGPHGWSCRTRSSFPFARAWAGSCTKGADAFAWLPSLPKMAVGP